MNLSEIKELLELFDSGSIRELDLKQGDLALYLSKNETSRVAQTESINVQQEVPVAPVVQPAVVTQTASVPSEPEVATKETTDAVGELVTSPIVGVVYTSSDPSAPSFVNVGDKVAVGDTLCIVEAMKIMNEIKSDVAGTVTEILIENEDVVEFGQGLFRIN